MEIGLVICWSISHHQKDYFLVLERKMSNLLEILLEEAKLSGQGFFLLGKSLRVAW